MQQIIDYTQWKLEAEVVRNSQKKNIVEAVRKNLEWEQVGISIICIFDISSDLHSTKQEITFYKLEQNKITKRYKFIVYIFENFLQQTPVTS